MELDGVSTPILPIQGGPIVQPQAVPEPPESEPVADGEEVSGKAKGVVSKLNEGGHFKGVADVRLRVAHFDNPDLEPIDPDDLPNPEDVPGKAYEKFFGQYEDKYADWLDSQSLAEPDEPVVVASEPELNPVEEPVVEPLSVPDEPVVAEVLVDEGEGILAAFEELWEAPPTEEEAGTVDIVM